MLELNFFIRLCWLVSIGKVFKRVFFGEGGEIPRT